MKFELLVLFGVLADDPKSNIDMLLVGDNYGHKLSEWASNIENKEGRELNYMILIDGRFLLPLYYAGYIYKRPI